MNYDRHKREKKKYQKTTKTKRDFFKGEDILFSYLRQNGGELYIISE